MIQPGHNIFQPVACRAGRHCGPVNHHYRQSKIACSLQLGLRACTTRVLCHDHLDPVLFHQRLIPCHVKRPARDHDVNLGKRQLGVRRVDQTDQKVMLGATGEVPKILLTDGQEHPRWRLWQYVNGTCDVRHMLPSVSGTSLPWRALKCSQRHARFGAGLYGMRAHLRSKRVRCIHNGCDLLGLQIGPEPLHAAKPTHARRQGLHHGRRGASGIGKHGLVATLGQRARQARCFAGAAQNKDAWHG